MCLRFADLERKLGEIDRARAVYAHGSQMADPRVSTLCPGVDVVEYSLVFSCESSFFCGRLQGDDLSISRYYR